MDQCLEYAEPELEPEPPDPARFARSRSRSPQDVLLGPIAGVGAEMVFPEPEPDPSKKIRLRVPAQNTAQWSAGGKIIFLHN